MTGNEDLTVQFGEDPPWDDLPPVDQEKANKELESRLIFDSWTCRFCGGTFADRTLAIKHIDNLRCENIVYRQTALDSAIKNNPVMSKSVEKRVLVQIQDIVKSLNLHCKMEDEHE